MSSSALFLAFEMHNFLKFFPIELWFILFHHVIIHWHRSWGPGFLIFPVRCDGMISSQKLQYLVYSFFKWSLNGLLTIASKTCSWDVIFLVWLPGLCLKNFFLLVMSDGFVSKINIALLLSKAPGFQFTLLLWIQHQFLCHPLVFITLYHNISRKLFFEKGFSFKYDIRGNFRPSAKTANITV